MCCCFTIPMLVPNPSRVFMCGYSVVGYVVRVLSLLRRSESLVEGICGSRLRGVARAWPRIRETRGFANTLSETLCLGIQRVSLWFLFGSGASRLIVDQSASTFTLAPGGAWYRSVRVDTQRMFSSFVSIKVESRDEWYQYFRCFIY